MTDFHFLRPEILLAFIPLSILLLLQIRKSQLSGKWSQIVAPQLQEFIIKQNDHTSAFPWFKLICGLCLSFIIIAAAGPAWDKQASQIYSSRSGLIIALDLSTSMTAQDVSPSRLQRAKYKITDILNKERSRNIGLMPYASDANIASPLTRDADTLKALLPALDPFIMPGTGGSNALLLVEEAIKLFEQSQSQPKVLLMVTDGVEARDIEPAADLLKKNQIQLAILAIGTEQGAPMMQPDGRFFKGADGQPIMPALEWDNLKQLAKAANGRIQRFNNTDSDIDYLLKDAAFDEAFSQMGEEAAFDQWKDNGYWLMLPILLLALYAFRKGVVLIVLLALFQPSDTWALPDFLLNKDQQARKHFETDPEKAAELFQDPNWKASSLYKAGKYEEALSIWKNQDTAKSWYNQGNALAQLGQYDEALYAYDKALSKQPDLEEAKQNQSLVKYLKQQQEQQKQQQDGQSGDDKNSTDNQNQQGENGQQNDPNGSESSEQSSNSKESQSGSDEDSDSHKSLQDIEKEQSENPMNQLSEEGGDEEGQKSEDVYQKKALSDESGEESGLKPNQMNTTEPAELSEKDQAIMQMIQKIEDNPAGLLQRKFLRQHQQRNRNQQGGDRKSW